jgi:hypothetical protein
MTRGGRYRRWSGRHRHRPLERHHGAGVLHRGRWRRGGARDARSHGIHGGSTRRPEPGHRARRGDRTLQLSAFVAAHVALPRFVAGTETFAAAHVVGAAAHNVAGLQAAVA